MTVKARKYSPEKLDQLLAFQGRTNVWVSERLGVDESYIGKLRTGVRPITDDLATRIAALLDCPATLLLAEEPVESQVA